MWIVTPVVEWPSASLHKISRSGMGVVVREAACEEPDVLLQSRNGRSQAV
jgi:hypothetical protein